MKMKINHILLVCFVFFLFSFKSFSEIQKGKWEFIKEQEYCFIQSAPINTVIPEGKQRGEHYMLVYRMHKSPELIIQITAGFDFKTSDSIEVQIDNGSHVFYADEDSAWAKNDEKTIYAMKRGLEFVITGISSKGTEVIDTYSLKGFTAALNNLTEDC
tara:strand:+ start:211 stop:684 length:474 start_codon:yes stop_codon:yes gene_type:complete